MTACSIGGCSVLYLVVAIAGFLTYGHAVDSNILVNYPHLRCVSLVRLAVSVLVLFSYPLQLHPARTSMLGLVNKNVDDWFFSSTIVFLGLTFVTAIAVTDLGVLLAIVGATGSTCIGFILPGWAYCKLHPEPHFRRSLATALALFGVVFVPIALVALVL